MRGNVEDTEALAAAMDGHDVVIHLASNPDIARAAREPSIDFTQGTVPVGQRRRGHAALRARSGILYASGSGVYGDLGTLEAAEDHGPMLPVSTYGASKLAGENLIGSYGVHVRPVGLRLPLRQRRLGPRQTHGVGFDFARRLLDAQRDQRNDARGDAPSLLKILGDGRQIASPTCTSPSIVRAVLRAHARTTKDFEPYNVATGDYITVTEIAELAVECVGLPPGSVRFEYTGGDRGWKGDVPVVRIATQRIRALGWQNQLSSREALRQSMLAMIPEMQAGRM